jgi:hypothetical protein
MLTRRQAIQATGAAVAFLGQPAAAQLCGLRDLCRAEVQLDEIEAIQEESRWCWAACIENMFAHYGHPVSQTRIVEEAYGDVRNIPAQAWQVSRSLNRSWTDDNGDRFRSRLVAAYDHDADIVAISDAFIIDAIEHDRPLILGARGHAVLLTAVEYSLFNGYPVPQRAECFDPWPGEGNRQLSFAEIVPAYRQGAMRYLAAVRIT